MSKRMTPNSGGVKIIKEADGGVGRMRCPNCQNLAVSKVLPDGKQVLQCHVCGSVLVEKKF